MTIAHRTKIGALTFALLAAWLVMPMTSATADDIVDKGAVLIAGTAHLEEGIPANNEDGCFGGKVIIGAGTTEASLFPPDAAVAAAGNDMFAEFTYSNPDVVAGTASGHLQIQDATLLTSTDPTDIHADFTWSRTGVVALVSLDGNNEQGVAVASFVPVEPAVFPCGGERKDGTPMGHGSWPNDGHAFVVGVGVITN